ncbi:hypothetical protein [Roseivirga misakiensis]|uniref:Lipoprotein n=1 Tax=Roseivirga misakiensis TaxID=1563681 RepID=A0A1E5T4K5_9BACT|nr:hypothetical protein [Roseivirga misakiensis]OEK06207.1 hypothetical protein BFP71_00585 [Roseivirga misakiensis]
MSHRNRLKGYLLQLLGVIGLYSCAARKTVEGSVEGTYLMQGSFNKQLLLTKDRYFLLKPFEEAHISPYKCCDTLSVGEWKRVNGTSFLSLKSDLKPIDPLLEMKVQEGFRSSSDSLYFTIDNPIQKDKALDRHKGLSYQVLINSNNPRFDEELSQRRFNNNEIAVKKPANLSITSFEIIAIPSMEMPVRSISIRHIYTNEYRVKGKSSNEFLVDVPELTYRLISELRFAEDFVRVISPTQLEWDGKRYIKR